MKKITLLLFLLTVTFTSYAQLSEDFETDPPSGWTFMQTETDDPGWVQTTIRANSGAASFFHDDANIASESTSWMISPAYTVSADDKLSFFYNNNFNTYSVESGVWISTASGDPIANPSDFTEIFDIDANFSEDVWASHEYELSSYVGQTIYVAFKYRGDYADEIYIDDFSIASPPSCVTPTAITLDAVTNNTATISWIAGGTETMWEYVVEAYDSDSDEPTGTAYSTTSNPLTVSGLTANTPYDFYIRADCGGGDFSSWTKVSFSTDCDIADGALFHDFNTLDNNNLVVDASCWSLLNQGDANTWGLVQNSTTNNISWRIQWSSTAHDDYLYSPSFTVLDDLTDAFNFKGWSSSTSYIESINLLVVDATDNTVIATLENDLDLPYVADEADATRFTYDLSAYEGQDVKIGFHSTTTDLYYAYLDEFTLDAFSTLGTSTNTLEGFTLYPTIVKEELNFRSQNNVEAITVFNVLGQKVFSGAPNTNNSSINLSTLRPGVYVVKVSAEGKIGSYKIIKE